MNKTKNKNIEKTGRHKLYLGKGGKHKLCIEEGRRYNLS